MNLWNFVDEMKACKRRERSVEEIEAECFEMFRSTLICAYTSAVEFAKNIPEKYASDMNDEIMDWVEDVDDIDGVFLCVGKDTFVYHILDEKDEVMVESDYPFNIPEELNFTSSNRMFERITGIEICEIKLDSRKPTWTMINLMDTFSFNNYEHEEYIFEVYDGNEEIKREPSDWIQNGVVSQQNSRKAVLNMISKIFPDAEICAYDGNVLCIEVKNWNIE